MGRQNLNPDTVRSSVARRLGLPDAGITRQDRYTDGLVDVLLDATANYDQPLTRERLHGWQAALFPTGFAGLHRIIVGDFRAAAVMQVVSGPTGRQKIHYEAPPGNAIEKEMALFLAWWRERQGREDGILRAAIAGFWFVSIHPYEDGNGRLDITDWLVWFLGCFERAIARSDQLIGTVLQKARFWEIHGQTQLTPRQRKVVNHLLDAGPGGFAGALTTKKYAATTRASRATSYREISDLLNKKMLLQNPGQGRSVSYDLAWPA